MSAPRMNRHFVLEVAVPAPDGAGGEVSVWTALGTIWGELRTRSGRETNGEAGSLSTASYRITIRAAPVGQSKRPVAGQRLLLGTRVFHIHAVTETDVDVRFLTCLAEEEVAQ